MRASLVSPQGIKSLIGAIGTIGTTIGGGIAYRKNAEVNSIKKEMNAVKKELFNKTETYQGIFSNALNKITNDVKNSNSSPLHKIGDNLKNIGQFALNNTKDMRQYALNNVKETIKTYPSLALIGGGMAIYTLYDQIQKQQKKKKLKSAQKNINNYLK